VLNAITSKLDKHWHTIQNTKAETAFHLKGDELSTENINRKFQHTHLPEDHQLPDKQP
jgi:hypothetical protein